MKAFAGMSKMMFHVGASFKAEIASSYVRLSLDSRHCFNTLQKLIIHRHAYFRLSDSGILLLSSQKIRTNRVCHWKKVLRQPKEDPGQVKSIQFEYNPTTLYDVGSSSFGKWCDYYRYSVSSSLWSTLLQAIVQSSWWRNGFSSRDESERTIGEAIEKPLLDYRMNPEWIR